MRFLRVILLLVTVSGFFFLIGAQESAEQAHEQSPPTGGLDAWESQRLTLVLNALGQRNMDNLPDYMMDDVSPELGADIVNFGFSKRKNQPKSKQQSAHFVCTSCHNTVREDFDLSVSDPEERLSYAETNDLPFLPGTSLYGVVNRTSFYNGDYYKKYGDLVYAAQEDLRGAIQLCATECAQGRELKDYEMESVLAYLWTIDLKMSDLLFSESEKTTITKAIQGDVALEKEALGVINTKYLKGSPAEFGIPPEDRKIGYNLEGNSDRGKAIYERGCLHCHEEGRYSFLDLDQTKLTYKWLNNKLPTWSKYSLYQVVRYGTYPKNGKRSYMPHYTMERMSDQQIEDLRAYIEHQASL